MAEKKFVPDEGLLFYLSGDKESVADYAMGEKNPTFFEKVEIIDGGVDGGKAFQCGDRQLMAYKAPGNIYAERGTLSFFWRSRYPVGATPFPIFRVSYADSSSWDHCFLRIDYNGENHGIDAFVTDINRARTRVSTTLHPFPKANEWIHIAFAWDENIGVRLYINGDLLADKAERKIYTAGLDQFGPHSRIISSWAVQSDYQFIRGGDIDEIKIYDRMLDEENIRKLLKNKAIKDLPEEERLLSEPVYRAEWDRRFGWDNDLCQPKYYEGNIVVRKIGIRDVYDKKRWCYKAVDGIRETGWPGVYSRSRLPGRNDYFKLPDGDCYSDSGKSVTFTIPDEEQWNHIEISGSAFGRLTLLDGKKETPLGERPRYLERSVHIFERPYKGKKIRFDSDLIEEPIGDFSAYFVRKGTAPRDSKRVETFFVDANQAATKKMTKEAQRVAKFVRERYLPDEQNLSYGVKKAVDFNDMPEGLPFVNIIVPYENLKADGLDGVAITVPALDTAYATDGYANVNIQIKDPLWMYRNLCNFTFKMRVGEEKKIFFDLRDRIIPADRAMYITVACSSEDFTSASLQGMQIDLHYKAQKAALPEHIEDRLTEVRDNYGNMLKEHPMRPQYDMFNRFIQDLLDILKYDPKNELAKQYLWDCREESLTHNRAAGSPDMLEAQKKLSLRGFPLIKPEYKAPKVPAGIEEWAFQQVEMIKKIKTVADWWIENRMDENGEFGSGLASDGERMQSFIALEKLGIEPAKYEEAHALQLREVYRQDLLENGLPMNQTDAYQAYREGIRMLTQRMIDKPWDPIAHERAMETARGLYRVTARNRFGERLFVSSNYSYDKAAREAPWNETNAEAYLVTGPAILVALYSGNEMATRMVLSLADSLVNHFRDGKLHTIINFDTGADAEEDPSAAINVLLGAYLLTGDEKYKAALRGDGWEKWFSNSEFLMSQTFERGKTADINAAAAEKMAFREYINTEGQIWSDRVVLDIKDAEIERLGGVLVDKNYQIPMNPITWSFDDPNDALNIGIMVPYATDREFKVIAFNMTGHAIKANMVGCRVASGIWRIQAGIDDNGAQEISKKTRDEKCYFENYEEVPVVFPAKQTAVITMKIERASLLYKDRPDLGISKEDTVVTPSEVLVTVHSLGHVDAPESEIALYNAEGREVRREKVPALKAPNDLYAKTATVSLKASGNKKGYKVVLDPDEKLFEVTRKNNTIEL